MPWQPNTDKERLIRKHGVTYGLPLFETSPALSSSPQPSPQRGEGVGMPDWIWSGSGVKAEVFELLKNKFNQDAIEYLKAIVSIGGRATDHEVKEKINSDRFPLHIVAARRNHWVGHPYYIIESFPGQKKKGPHGVANTIWFVNFKNLFKIINEVHNG